METKMFKSRISRRDFLKTAGIGAAAVAATVGGASVLAGCKSGAEKVSWDLTADIVVVGSGAGAMSAAVTARNQGASIIMLEKSSITGGTTAKSGGESWIPNNFALRPPASRTTGMTVCGSWHAQLTRSYTIPAIRAWAYPSMNTVI